MKVSSAYECKIQSYAVYTCVELFTFFQGWIRHMRKQKHVNFIQLSDGTGKPAAQIVTSPEICSKYLKNFLFLNIVIQR